MDTSLQTIEDDVRAFQIQAYLGIAGFCLIIYDILLTWDVEISLVWPAPVSLVKLLFLWNRYVMPSVYIWVVYMLSGLVTDATDDYCFAFYVFSFTFQSICTNFVSATLMLLRVYALYARDKRVVAILSVLLAAELGLSVAVSVVSCIYARDQITYVAFLGTCTMAVHVPWVWVVFLFMSFFDIAIFLLVLWKTWQHVRVSQVGTSLLTALLVDGVWYFLIMLGVEFVNIFTFAIFSSTYFLVALNIAWCLNTMMVSRIYLNLRKTARPQDWSDMTAFKTPGPSPIRYHSTRHEARSEEDSVESDVWH